MIKKFTKKELERLNCTEDDISLVMKYQKLLPMPDTDFEMNARTLHGHLGVGRDASTWVTSRIRKYDFKENIDYRIKYESDDPNLGDVDFTSFSSTQLSRKGVRKEYYLTVNMCKELCTIENNELGRIARRYFILMERIVVENEEWLEIRDPEKVEYKNMCSEIDAWNFRIWHKNAGKTDYAVEADGINMIVMGKKSQELKLEYGCPTNELLRDYLKKNHNKELPFLERQNQVLLRMDMGYTERMTLLAKMHEVTFKNKVSERAA